MSYWIDFALTLVATFLGAFIGVKLARWSSRKRDAAEHDRQMAEWDARLDALKRIPPRGPRLFSPN